MKIQEYSKLYRRDLKKLKDEIELYKSEKNLWLIDKEIANSAGNLCLHIIGNLNHFIGSALGKTGYIRNREDEFTLKNIPLKDLLFQTDNTVKVVDHTLQNISDNQLEQDYPFDKFEEKATIEFLLSYLLIHLSYHLGQINYHRRLFDS